MVFFCLVLFPRARTPVFSLGSRRPLEFLDFDKRRSWEPTFDDAVVVEALLPAPADGALDVLDPVEVRGVVFFPF